jgi:hypothetical protein
MTANNRNKKPMTPDDLPPEVLPALARLWKVRQHINVRILPRDAYLIAAIIQFADRNPALSESHHELLYAFGNQLIDGVARLEPTLEKYLNWGWDPLHDVTVKKEEE